MSSTLFDLGGRTALVTGSSRGLGRAMAQGLAEAGAAVVVNGQSPEGVAKAAAELRAAGHTVHEAAFDVTDEAAVAAAFERFDADGLAIDILVNNAGIQIRSPIVEMTSETWRKVLETNLTSAFLVGREAGKRMLPRGRGKVVNIGSVTSGRARPTVAPYSAAKGGIVMLTRVMAAEWAASGVQVNCIGPGYMLTDMNEALISNPEFDAWVKGRTPAQRWGAPEELIGTVVYLCSPASDYVNGQMVYVDGGMMGAL